MLLGAGITMPQIMSAADFGLFTRKIKASDQINFGLIGCKGMGWSNMNAHLKLPQVNCIALSDVDQSVLDQRTEDVFKLRGKRPKQYRDYRKLLEDPAIDVVIIGTPDHWHCLNMVDAVSADKHVYVEKPIANTIEECQIMVKAQQRYGKIVQVGQWQRSGSQYAEAIDYVKSGKLGQIRLVKCWAYQGWMKPVPKLADSLAPTGVDYNMWLGPAPKRDFNQNRFHFNFRWFWDYAGGLMTDWGVHLIDYALLGMDAKFPKSVMAIGGKFAYPDGAHETPDTLTTVYEFDGYSMIWEQAQSISNGNYGRDHGISFIGNNGTLVLARGGWEVIPDEKRMEAVPLQMPKQSGLDLHTANFIDVVKSRKQEQLTCPIQAGAHVATVCQMGNISYRSGGRLYWDETKAQFREKEANVYLNASYKNGYNLPKIGS